MFASFDILGVLSLLSGIFGMIVSAVPLRTTVAEFSKDLQAWREWRKYRREGERFIRSIGGVPEDRQARWKSRLSVLATALSLTLISTGLMEILDRKTMADAAAAAILSMSAVLLFSVGDIWRRLIQLRLKSFEILYVIGSFLVMIGVIGIFWGAFLGVIYPNLPLLWAGMLATACVAAEVWFISWFLGKWGLPGSRRRTGY